jgi:hypothetical protein
MHLGPALAEGRAIGCDAVSVDGFECGGHPGEDDMPNMILLPRAAEELKIPFVASGGMADARSLVAALALGAEGMNMGTRFIATKEAPVHPNVKKALVAASELDTRLVMRALRNTERVLKNKGVDRLLEIEREKGASLKIADIHEQVAGVYPKVMIDGEMDAGAWSCGMVAGLIHDIPTVKELIDRIMAEAEPLGLVNRVVPDAELREAAFALANRWPRDRRSRWPASRTTSTTPCRPISWIRWTRRRRTWSAPRGRPTTRRRCAPSSTSANRVLWGIKGVSVLPPAP